MNELMDVITQKKRREEHSKAGNKMQLDLYLARRFPFHRSGYRHSYLARRQVLVLQQLAAWRHQAV